MIELISLFHFTVCIMVLSFAFKIILSKRISLIAFTVSGFILIDSLGLSFAPYLPLSKIEYLNSPSFLINEQNTDLYIRQLFAHWMFFALACGGLIFQLRFQLPKHDVVAPTNQNSRFWVPILLGISIILYYRYFIAGPGLNILLNSRISFDSTTEAVTQRSLLRYSFESGQGAYLASIAAKILLPISTSLAILNKSRFQYLIWLFCLTLSVLYAFQTREKSPLIAAFLIYVMLLVWRRTNWNLVNFNNFFKLAISGVTAFFFLGTLFYSVNFGLDFSAAIQAILSRTLAIPGATEVNFFAVFPEQYDFRGILNTIRISLLGFGGKDPSIYEVAIAATGNGFATNASFLAVAWSGAGYFGVLLISSIFIMILYGFDKILNRFEYNIYILTIILLIPSFIGLTSGSILDYTGWGGIISPTILLLCLSHSQVFFLRHKRVYRSP